MVVFSYCEAVFFSFIALYAYVKMCSTDKYLHSLLAVTDIQDDIVNHLPSLTRIIGSNDCNVSIRLHFFEGEKDSLIARYRTFLIQHCISCSQVIPQLIFDPDIIEVNNGRIFKLSSMCLVSKCPFTSDDIGRVSPRTFQRYNDEAGYHGGCFAACVRHNFPDPPIRANFLIKFYQCLLATQPPIKTPKLYLVGPSDFGKSSMAQVLFGLTHPENLATISKEKTFGLSMLNEHTQLVFIDEMNADLMPADVAKIFLQGDMLTMSRKHANAEMIDNCAGEISFAYALMTFVVNTL